MRRPCITASGIECSGRLPHCEGPAPLYNTHFKVNLIGDRKKGNQNCVGGCRSVSLTQHGSPLLSRWYPRTSLGMHNNKPGAEHREERGQTGRWGDAVTWRGSCPRVPPLRRSSPLCFNTGSFSFFHKSPRNLAKEDTRFFARLTGRYHSEMENVFHRSYKGKAKDIRKVMFSSSASWSVPAKLIFDLK
jgi:hypothetical protein